MEMLNAIYPYTLTVLYALSVCALLLLFAFMIQVFSLRKSVKPVLASVSSIKTKTNTLTLTYEQLSKDIKEKNSRFQQGMKKLGLFFTAWHLIFPKKDKRRR